MENALYLYHFSAEFLLYGAMVSIVCTALHTILRSMVMDDEHHSYRVFYDACVLVHIFITATILAVVAGHYDTFYYQIGSFIIPVEPLLWLNIPLAIIMFCRIRFNYPVRSFIEGALTLCVTPFAARLFGPLFAWVLLVDCIYFLGRSLHCVVSDANHVDERVTYLTYGQTVQKLPEGFAFIDSAGKIFLMNDAMRGILRELNMETDFQHGGNIWPQLQNAKKAFFTKSKNGLALRLPNRRTYLFSKDTVYFGSSSFTRIVALDITRETKLTDAIGRSTQKEAIAQQELLVALANVQNVAKNDALLFTRSRVHDIIGQRLSILHRYLEDGDLSEETFANIQPLLRDILEDLNAHHKADSKSDLYAIISAFALINMVIDVEGEPPEDAAIAAAFVQIIREACTNAVKHGRAKHVIVRMQEKDGVASLSVSNDGEVAPDSITKGTGLPGMEYAVSQLGGMFWVTNEGMFTVHAEVSLDGQFAHNCT